MFKYCIRLVALRCTNVQEAGGAGKNVSDTSCDLQSRGLFSSAAQSTLDNLTSHLQHNISTRRFSRRDANDARIGESRRSSGERLSFKLSTDRKLVGKIVRYTEAIPL